jgi:hypothetical protein
MEGVISCNIGSYLSRAKKSHGLNSDDKLSSSSMRIFSHGPSFRAFSSTDQIHLISRRHNLTHMPLPSSLYSSLASFLIPHNHSVCSTTIFPFSGSVPSICTPLSWASICLILSCSSCAAVSPNTRSISSNVFPLVSGTKKYVNPPANKQNAAKKIYVPHLIWASMSGVTRPMIKLHIQVVEVVIEIAFERIASVKISEGRTQPMGAIHSSKSATTLLSAFLFGESVTYRMSRRSSHRRCK